MPLSPKEKLITLKNLDTDLKNRKWNLACCQVGGKYGIDIKTGKSAFHTIQRIRGSNAGIFFCEYEGFLKLNISPKTKQEWMDEMMKNGVNLCCDNERVGEDGISVSGLCVIKKGAENEIHKKYEIIKDIVKEKYFKNRCDSRINKYKRAAVLVQAIVLSSPLIYSNEELQSFDPYLLKQRLAFYVAINSIIHSFNPSIEIEKQFYSFDIFDRNISKDEDSFLESVYKDIFFSELYGNYNILTMANVFGIITETASILPGIIDSSSL